ncbi:MAG: glycosyltransferase family 4 protein [Blastocatellia bacterium]|nr:glycosyltransferase family 4 protein [Blastocatellia bacterium]MCX7752635.1 glycosyltransferase family 4 protein [Blastocatellia bacterium]MDW8168366.1 glycosyltransferase family 4 protein [Acidobacteriota bacterium]
MIAPVRKRARHNEVNDADKPIRVVHVSPAYFDERSILGGGERYATELARAMARLTPTRLVSFAARADEQESRLEWASLEVRLFRPFWYPRGQRTNPVSLRFLTALADADVIHCHQFHVVATTLAIAYARVTGKRVFVTDLGGGGWDVSYHLDTGRWVNGFLHLSQFSAQRFARYEGKNRIIFAGVDVERFRPLPGRTYETVLYVGRLLPHKGINYLVEAVDATVELRLVGRLWEPQLGATRSAEYLELLRTLARGKCVSFIFNADDERLVREYNAALVTVLPSVYTDVFGTRHATPELFGLTLLEAMACATPVIATTVGALPEIVEDGVTGFLVPPNDARALADRIAWLRRHPEEARRMGERGRARVLERFTWEAVARRCLAIYREALRTG